MQKRTGAPRAAGAPVLRKRCAKCKKRKSFAEFHADKSRASGLYPVCKSCESARRRATSKQRHTRRMSRREGHGLAGRIQELAWIAKSRAKQSGVEHSLSKAWVEKAAQSTSCPVTGLLFVIGAARVNGAPHPLSPSLDRIDPTKGYTDGNTRVVSYFVNVAKSAWSQEQFEMLVMAAASNLRH